MLALVLPLMLASLVKTRLNITLKTSAAEKNVLLRLTTSLLL